MYKTRSIEVPTSGLVARQLGLTSAIVMLLSIDDHPVKCMMVRDIAKFFFYKTTTVLYLKHASCGTRHIKAQFTVSNDNGDVYYLGLGR